MTAQLSQEIRNALRQRYAAGETTRQLASAFGLSKSGVCLQVRDIVRDRVRTKEPIEVRFWRHVKKGPYCWLWTGTKNRKGYGLIREGGGKECRMVRAHRVAVEIEDGPIPEGLEPLHTCDNPPCVRRSHLVLGTQLDNIADMVAKRRHSFGERRPSAKLTAALAEEIRARYAAGGVFQKDLAKEYGISQSQVSAIVCLQNWKDTMPMPIPTDELMRRAGASPLPGFD